MVIPNIWSQGQLFAFSALDGTAHIKDDFPGILCGDKLGIRFFSKVKRELVVTVTKQDAPEFETVTGDLITLRTAHGKIDFIYADAHLICGSLPAENQVLVMTEGQYRQETAGSVLLQDTQDGEITGLLRQGDRFAFAYGHSREEVLRLVTDGIALPLEPLKTQRLQLYQDFSLNHEYGPLYAKCLSVMKTQLYSPEGQFKQIWSTPDRLPHRRLWLWDSVFHAIGHRHLDAALAEGLILSVCDTQQADGFIPHMSSPDKCSSITQPPVIAMGAWLVYEISGNKTFLKTVYESNKKFLLWCRENRRDSDAELYTWKTQSLVTCRCDECGMDNSPRFDLDTRLEAIDFSCFMANETRIMERIALELEDPEGACFFGAWYASIKTAVNEKLWCREDGFYYDYDIQNKRFHKVQTVASFLPLLAGICDEKQAKSLVAYLQDPAHFHTPFPIPSVSRQHPTYGTDMWRGAVWLNYNHMIIGALETYGYQTLADNLRNKTLDVLNRWYLRKGTLFEFYDSEDLYAPNELNRKGTPFEPYDFQVRYQSIRDYGWSCALCFDLLHRKYA